MARTRIITGLIGGLLAGLVVGNLLGTWMGFSRASSDIRKPATMPSYRVIPAEPPASRPTTLPRFIGAVPRPEYRARGPAHVPESHRGLYLDLLKMSLTDLLYLDDPRLITKRSEGREWPDRALTMIGLKRLDNLHMCMEDVLANNVPGDFVEAGAWRGGATIFMRAVLKDYGVTDRKVWVADSFEGVPPPDPEKYPIDTGDTLHTEEILAVSLEEVKANFARHGLLDEQVHFLKGWFKDTLHKAPIGRIAVLRLDGDLYESTMDTLVPLYDKVSPGGYIIADDLALGTSLAAVNDFRKQRGITEEMKQIDWTGWYWQKKK